MLGIRHWMLVFLGCWLAMVATGQQVPSWLAEEGVPPAPPERVIDHAGLFNRNSEGLERIKAAFGRMEREHGFRLYLVVEPVMIRGSAPELAARLQQAWLPEEDGFVIVFEAGSAMLGIGRGMESETEPGRRGQIPSYEMVRLLSEISATPSSDVPQDAYLEAVMAELVAALDDYFQRRKAAGTPGRTLRVALIAAGTMAILALAALGVGWVLRRSEAQSSRVYLFPEVNLPERLGAPAGGGDVTSRRFGGDPPAGGDAAP